jgi:hypothetical protein
MTPRGGNREGAGRKSRPSPKALGIWCGQISQEQRDFIMRWLTPDERFGVLWAAANTACTGRGLQPPAKQVESTAEVKSTAKVTGKRQPRQ